MKVNWTKREKDIIHKISIDNMIPERDVENMVIAQFLMLREALEEGSPMEDSLLNVMLPKFGKFYHHSYMARKYREHNNGKHSKSI